MSTVGAPPRARKPPDTQLIAVAITGGIALAFLTVLGLGVLGQPVGLDSRLAALDHRLTHAEALRASPGDPDAFGKEAVCSRLPGSEAATLQRDLGGIGQALHLPLVKVSTFPAEDNSKPSVRPTRFTFEANASYAAALEVLQRLAHYKTAVVLDRADIISQSSFVHLHLDGRIYCWTAPSS